MSIDKTLQEINAIMDKIDKSIENIKRQLAFQEALDGLETLNLGKGALPIINDNKGNPYPIVIYGL